MARIKRVNTTSGLADLFPQPICAERNPGSGDSNHDPGQVWVNEPLLDVFILAGFSSGTPQWINVGGGAGTYSSLTVTPGPTAITGKFTVTSGTENVSIGADAADHDVDLGSATGSSALTIQWGTGGAVLAGAAGGALTVGAAAQTAAMTFGRSTAANTLNFGTGVNTGAQVLNVATGASAADSTVNVLSGVATAGTQTLNVLSGDSTSTGQAINLLTGAGSGTRVFTLAGGSAIATTIGIGDGVLGNTLTLGNGANSVAQSVSIANGASAADSTVNILSGLATAGTQTLNLANGEYAKAVNIANGALGNTVLIANGANSVAQTVSIANGASGADSTLNLMAGASSAGTQTVNLATGTGGGTAKIVNIGNADGNTDLAILSPRESSAGASHTLNASRGRVTATGLTTASGADETITITNNKVAATSGIIVGICTVTATDARPVLEKVVPAAGSFTVQYVNDGAASLDGDLIISFEVYN